MKKYYGGLIILALFLILLTGCVKPSNNVHPWPTVSGLSATSVPSNDSPTNAPESFLPPTRIPGSPILTPTPDAPHNLPTQRSGEEQYTVQRGDTLGTIAQRYGLDLNTLIAANKIENPDILEVGITLTIPAAPPLPPGPSFKIIPDSELVYGPASATLNISKFIQEKAGYLNHYTDEVDGISLNGAQIIEKVAQEYSVNPRLLLAILDYQSGWVTKTDPPDSTREFPIGYIQTNYKGLYRQLSWAASNLNRGYYLWKVGGISGWILADGNFVPPAPTLNPGTSGVQQFFSLLYGQSDWNRAVGEEGLFKTYQSFFGYPFDLAIEPVLPENLAQPAMQLPFETGTVWSFTGGPHAGWGPGSAWAAIDFAPPGDALGCVASNAWVVAVADGIIIRAQNGEVVEDINDPANGKPADGLEQTGWTVLYMHIATHERIMPKTQVKAGDHIGHPSCEGGVSNGTHTHLARRYNGEWISADGALPFNLDGWISKGNGTEYDGWLVRGDQSVEAWDARKDENQIHR
jgi:LasA protease